MEVKTYFKDKNYSRKKKKRTRTKEESAYLEAVKKLPCCVCGAPPPSDAHHLRDFTGMGMRASDYDTLPLCKNHHQGQEGFHTLGRKEWEEIYGLQRDYVKQTQEKLKHLLTDV